MSIFYRIILASLGAIAMVSIMKPSHAGELTIYAGAEADNI